MYVLVFVFLAVSLHGGTNGGKAASFANSWLSSLVFYIEKHTVYIIATSPLQSELAECKFHIFHLTCSHLCITKYLIVV